MFRRVHNHGNGHHGINRTMRMLHMRGVRWPKMAKDLTQFIAQCEHCNKNRIKQEDLHTQRGSLGQFAMFEEVSIDFIGPSLPINFRTSISAASHVVSPDLWKRLRLKANLRSLPHIAY
jgi:hypothetical protein